MPTAKEVVTVKGPEFSFKWVQGRALVRAVFLGRAEQAPPLVRPKKINTCQKSRLIYFCRADALTCYV